MNAKEEQAYIRGQRSAWASMCAQAARELGGGAQQQVGFLLAEREAAISVLRDLCAHHGDNDWEPRLHLADIIDKHLGRHIDDAAGKEGRPRR